MATIPTQIRIDSDIKSQATELFNQLGLDMSTAVNIFLRQAVMRQGLPFSVEKPHYKQEVIDAMNEALQISKDPNAKRYSSFADALKDIDL
ncbi:MAG: type II toxin-antitoxin system RelB/DinJ family antitoxin [Candidatus Ornithomonoglobus sp.]